MESRVKIDNIIKITGFSQQTIYTLKVKAKQQEYNPIVSLQLINSYLKDVLRSGWLFINLERKKKVISKITINCYGQKKTIADIVAEI